MEWTHETACNFGVWQAIVGSGQGPETISFESSDAALLDALMLPSVSMVDLAIQSLPDAYRSMVRAALPEDMMCTLLKIYNLTSHVHVRLTAGLEVTIELVEQWATQLDDHYLTLQTDIKTAAADPGFDLLGWDARVKKWNLEGVIDWDVA